MNTGIVDRPIFNTPVAILDFETTGLSPGNDRVVEVSVMRIEPGGKQRLVLDTLVNPVRPMSASEIHGITDDDVADAPRFEDIARDFVDALSGCVVAAYNVYFDMRFLDYELNRAGITDSPPHICLMYFRPLLNLGNRCSLGEACQAHGIPYTASHVAADDVRASAQLMEIYFETMRERSIRTFGELKRFKSYKFLDSLKQEPLTPQVAACLDICDRLKSRSGYHGAPKASSATERETKTPAGANKALGIYWDALKAAVADLVITDEEIERLTQIKEQLDLRVEQIRVLHARAFASVISQFTDDLWLDEQERRKLKRLHQCLRRLGWAPGE